MWIVCIIIVVAGIIIWSDIVVVIVVIIVAIATIGVWVVIIYIHITVARVFSAFDGTARIQILSLEGSVIT